MADFSIDKDQQCRMKVITDMHGGWLRCQKAKGHSGKCDPNGYESVPAAETPRTVECGWCHKLTDYVVRSEHDPICICLACEDAYFRGKRAVASTGGAAGQDASYSSEEVAELMSDAYKKGVASRSTPAQNAISFSCSDKCLCVCHDIARNFSSRSTPAAQMPIDLARRFHTLYETLAPKFGYETRKESARPWSQVPEQNKNLMIAVCEEILKDGRSLSATGETPQPLNTYTLLGSSAGFPDPEASERTLDEERAEHLLGRIRKAISEHNPKGTYACALWTQNADSDGCGICFSCISEDLREFTEAWLAARGKETHK